MRAGKEECGGRHAVLRGGLSEEREGAMNCGRKKSIGQERTKMGVFETQASITAIAPTVCAQQCSRHCKAGSMSEP